MAKKASHTETLLQRKQVTASNYMSGIADEYGHTKLSPFSKK